MLDVPQARVERRAWIDRRRPAEGDSVGAQRLRHDVRQPLSAVLLMVGALQMDAELSSTVRRRLRQIEDEAEWMAEMLSVGDDGEHSPQEVDLAAVVEQPLSALSAVATCRLRFRQTTGVRVRVDPVTLRRSVRNLLDNAVRAVGADGTVEVTVRGTATEAILDVADNGPGFGRIPQQQGLGLATVRRFAGDCGGSLHTGSSPLGGALVSIRLPLSTPDLCATNGVSA